MKKFISIFSALVLFCANNAFSQLATFDFESSVSGTGGPVPTQTKAGVVMTVTDNKNDTRVDIGDGLAGTVGFACYAADGNVPQPVSMTLSFSKIVDIASLRVGDLYGYAGNYTFTPNTGTAYTTLVDGASGTTVIHDFSKVTSIVITRQDGGGLNCLLDDVVMSQAYANSVTGLTVGSITSNQIPLTWTNPALSSGVIVLCRAGGPVQTSALTKGYGLLPAANSNFASAPDAGTSAFGAAGDKLVYRSTGTSVTTTNLAGGTTYYYRAFNWDGTYWSAGSSSSGNQPLPVELTSFTAASGLNAVTLNWETATEVNNYGFDVERKTTHDWFRVGFVEGHGSTSAPQSYSFGDHAASGKTFYRLKQMDRDGNFTYSKEIEVTSMAAPYVFALLQNHPNPFNPATEIRFTVPANGHATLKIFNAIGQEVATLFNGEAQSGIYHSVQFDASGLASGMYLSRLEYDGRVQLKKMILMK